MESISQMLDIQIDTEKQKVIMNSTKICKKNRKNYSQNLFFYFIFKKKL